MYVWWLKIVVIPLGLFADICRLDWIHIEIFIPAHPVWKVYTRNLRSQKKPASLKSFSVFQVVLPPTTFMVETGWSSSNLVVYPMFIHLLRFFFGRSFMNTWSFGGDKWIGLPAKRWNYRWRWRLEDKVLSTKMTWLKKSQCGMFYDNYDDLNHSRNSHNINLYVTQESFSSHSSMIARNNGANDPINIVLWNGLWLKMIPFFVWKNESRVEDILKAKLFVELNGCFVSTLIEI